MSRAAHVLCVFLLALFGASACGPSGSDTTSGGGGAGAGGAGGSGGSGGAAPATAFDPEHVLEVAITMAPADWDALRFQANDLEKLLGGDCLAGPKDSVFSYFHAAVSIDGQEYPDVGVRKKGFVGSLSVSRPSLKIKLDEYVPGGSFFDMDRLTLNNMKQDDSRVRTCLALERYAAAGVPASRCSFAHVTVNGQDLGVYANIESAEKFMLRRHFDDDDGNLYEGAMSDFRPEWVNTYEKKTNESDPDRSDLQALTDALQAPDAELLAQVEPLVDVDAFLTYWAMESILASWDGYTGGQNNHLVYHDPTTGKMFFLPWSPDATFEPDNPFASGDLPQSVYAASALPNRLYALPEIRQKYRERLLALLDQVMSPDAVMADIDRMEAVISPFVTGDQAAWKAEVDAVRGFVTNRAAALQAEVADGPVDYSYPMSDSPCIEVVGSATGSFSTTMGTLALENPFGTGDGALSLDVFGMAGDALNVGAAAGPDSGAITVTVVAAMPGGKFAVVVFLIDPSVLQKGADLPIDPQQAFGILGGVGSNQEFTLLGFLNNGTLHLDEAGLKDGDALAGTFTADVLGKMP